MFIEFTNIDTCMEMKISHRGKLLDFGALSDQEKKELAENFRGAVDMLEGSLEAGK